MCSESGGSENSTDSWLEERIIKAITYSDEKLLKNALKIYKREMKEVNKERKKDRKAEMKK